MDFERKPGGSGNSNLIPAQIATAVDTGIAQGFSQLARVVDIS